MEEILRKFLVHTEPQSGKGSDMLDRSSVIVEYVGQVKIITINRPQALNAVNRSVADGIGNALNSAEFESEVRAVVLTGAGSKAFCAGADLKAFAAGESIDSTDPADAARWGFGGYVRNTISKPTIAAVNGIALGGGTELVLASDLAVAAEYAIFGLPEVTRGIFAAGGGAFRLPEQLPRKIAFELLLTGDTLSAARALELGLVNRVVPGEEVLNAAIALAERITANAPLAVQASKRIAAGIIGRQVPANQNIWKRSDSELQLLLTSEDAAEGFRSFTERRSPIWKAR